MSAHEANETKPEYDDTYSTDLAEGNLSIYDEEGEPVKVVDISDLSFEKVVEAINANMVLVGDGPIELTYILGEHFSMDPKEVGDAILPPLEEGEESEEEEGEEGEEGEEEGVNGNKPGITGIDIDALISGMIRSPEPLATEPGESENDDYYEEYGNETFNDNFKVSSEGGLLIFESKDEESGAFYEIEFGNDVDVFIYNLGRDGMIDGNNPPDGLAEIVDAQFGETGWEYVMESDVVTFEYTGYVEMPSVGINKTIELGPEPIHTDMLDRYLEKRDRRAVAKDKNPESDVMNADEFEHFIAMNEMLSVDLVENDDGLLDLIRQNERDVFLDLVVKFPELEEPELLEKAKRIIDILEMPEMTTMWKGPRLNAVRKVDTVASKGVKRYVVSNPPCWLVPIIDDRYTSKRSLSMGVLQNFEWFRHEPNAKKYPKPPKPFTDRSIDGMHELMLNYWHPFGPIRVSEEVLREFDGTGKNEFSNVLCYSNAGLERASGKGVAGFRKVPTRGYTLNTVYDKTKNSKHLSYILRVDEPVKIRTGESVVMTGLMKLPMNIIRGEGGMFVVTETKGISAAGIAGIRRIANPVDRPTGLEWFEGAFIIDIDKSAAYSSLDKIIEQFMPTSDEVVVMLADYIAKAGIRLTYQELTSLLRTFGVSPGYITGEVSDTIGTRILDHIESIAITNSVGPGNGFWNNAVNGGESAGIFGDPVVKSVSYMPYTGDLPRIHDGSSVLVPEKGKVWAHVLERDGVRLMFSDYFNGYVSLDTIIRNVGVPTNVHKVETGVGGELVTREFKREVFGTKYCKRLVRTGDDSDTGVKDSPLAPLLYMISKKELKKNPQRYLDIIANTSSYNAEAHQYVTLDLDEFVCCEHFVYGIRNPDTDVSLLFGMISQGGDVVHCKYCGEYLRAVDFDVEMGFVDGSLDQMREELTIEQMRDDLREDGEIAAGKDPFTEAVRLAENTLSGIEVEEEDKTFVRSVLRLGFLMDPDFEELEPGVVIAEVIDIIQRLTSDTMLRMIIQNPEIITDGNLRSTVNALTKVYLKDSVTGFKAFMMFAPSDAIKIQMLLLRVVIVANAIGVSWLKNDIELGQTGMKVEAAASGRFGKFIALMQGRKTIEVLEFINCGVSPFLRGSVLDVSLHQVEGSANKGIKIKSSGPFWHIVRGKLTAVKSSVMETVITMNEFGAALKTIAAECQDELSVEIESSVTERVYIGTDEHRVAVEDGGEYAFRYLSQARKKSFDAFFRKFAVDISLNNPRTKERRSRFEGEMSVHPANALIIRQSEHDLITIGRLPEVAGEVTRGPNKVEWRVDPKFAENVSKLPYVPDWIASKEKARLESYANFPAGPTISRLYEALPSNPDVVAGVEQIDEVPRARVSVDRNNDGLRDYPIGDLYGWINRVIPDQNANVRRYNEYGLVEKLMGKDPSSIGTVEKFSDMIEWLVAWPDKRSRESDDIKLVSFDELSPGTEIAAVGIVESTIGGEIGLVMDLELDHMEAENIYQMIQDSSVLKHKERIVAGIFNKVSSDRYGTEEVAKRYIFKWIGNGMDNGYAIVYNLLYSLLDPEAQNALDQEAEAGADWLIMLEQETDIGLLSHVLKVVGYHFSQVLTREDFVFKSAKYSASRDKARRNMTVKNLAADLERTRTVASVPTENESKFSAIGAEPGTGTGDGDDDPWANGAEMGDIATRNSD